MFIKHIFEILNSKNSNEFVQNDREPAPNDLVVIINDSEMSFIIRMLHAISDGTSLSILTKDLLSFYDELSISRFDFSIIN